MSYLGLDPPERPNHEEIAAAGLVQVSCSFSDASMTVEAWLVDGEPWSIGAPVYRVRAGRVHAVSSHPEGVGAIVLEGDIVEWVQWDAAGCRALADSPWRVEPVPDAFGVPMTYRYCGRVATFWLDLPSYTVVPRGAICDEQVASAPGIGLYSAESGTGKILLIALNSTLPPGPDRMEAWDEFARRWDVGDAERARLADFAPVALVNQPRLAPRIAPPPPATPVQRRPTPAEALRTRDLVESIRAMHALSCPLPEGAFGEWVVEGEPWGLFGFVTDGYPIFTTLDEGTGVLRLLDEDHWYEWSAGHCRKVEPRGVVASVGAVDGKDRIARVCGSVVLVAGGGGRVLLPVGSPCAPPTPRATIPASLVVTVEELDLGELQREIIDAQLRLQLLSTVWPRSPAEESDMLRDARRAVRRAERSWRRIQPEPHLRPEPDPALGAAVRARDETFLDQVWTDLTAIGCTTSPKRKKSHCQHCLQKVDPTNVGARRYPNPNRGWNKRWRFQHCQK